MIENDTWYRCNICGREGRVGRCCSDEDRTPLNTLAKAEQERIKGAPLKVEWERLKKVLSPENWNAGQEATYFGFFCHGWYGRLNEAAYQAENNGGGYDFEVEITG